MKQVIRGDGTNSATRPRPKRAGSEAKGEGERHRVVIADDHADTRVILRHYLEAFGLGVSEASDGKQALSEMKRVDADVVILDMQMPRLDGIGVLETIRGNADTATLPVIVLTGDVESLDRARAAGANECLTKPAHPRALFEAVRTLLAQRDA